MIQIYCNTCLAQTAQMASDEQILQVETEGNKLLGYLMERFKPYIYSEHPELFINGQVIIGNYADFNAISDVKNHKIVIPAMFYLETIHHTQALIFTLEDPKLKQDYENYIEYLIARSNDARKKGDVDDIPLKSFWEFCKKKPPKNQTPEAKQRFANILEIMMIDGMGLILAHEIGHVILNHKGYSEISPENAREQEYAADAYGALLANKAGISVIPSLATHFVRFTKVEGAYTKSPNSERTHPPAECRFYKLGNLEFSKIINGDTKTKNEFTRHSGYSIPQFMDILKLLADKCKNENKKHF
jgi:hypothetical protein